MKFTAVFTFFFIFWSSLLNAQNNSALPYYFIDLDSGNYESIVQVKVFLDSTNSVPYEMGFRLIDGQNVGYAEYPDGYAFYTQSIDTFYLTYELNNIAAETMRCDTVGKINKGIVFVNPFPDFYIRTSSLPHQDPFLKMYFDECVKKNEDCRVARGRMYTEHFSKPGQASGCILNDQNGTLYYYLHSNGRVRAKGYFKDGLPKGKWEFYKPDGSFDFEYFFE
jgi:hypothetical protein